MGNNCADETNKIMLYGVFNMAGCFCVCNPYLECFLLQIWKITEKNINYTPLRYLHLQMFRLDRNCNYNKIFKIEYEYRFGFMFPFGKCHTLIIIIKYNKYFFFN